LKTIYIENSLKANQGGGCSVAARGTVQLIFARGCFMVGGYFIAVTLARELGPVDFGVYGVIMSVLVWIEMASSSGVPAATAKLVPEYVRRESDVEKTATVFLFVLSVALLILCWFLAPALARLFRIHTGATLFRVAILDLPLSGIYYAYQGVLRANRRFGTLSASLITYSLTKVLGVLLLTLLGLSVIGALAVNILATVGALVYLSMTAPNRGRFDYTLIKPLFRVALPLGFALAVMQVLVNVDLWFLKHLWTGRGEVVGMYVASLNVSRLLTVVPTVVNGMLFSLLSWALAQKNEALAREYIQSATRFALVSLLPACVLMSLNAEALMACLYSGVYRAGGSYLRLQVIAFGLFAMVGILANSIMAAGKYFQPIVVLVFLMPVAYLLNQTFIPRFGGVGAAASLLVTMVLGVGWLALTVYRRFGTPVKWRTPLRVAGAAAATGVLSTQWEAEGVLLLLKLSILGGIYLSLLVLMKELKQDDLKGFTLWRKDSQTTETNLFRSDISQVSSPQAEV
jgi:stage V sporulation protein B